MNPPDINATATTCKVLSEVLMERGRQDAKWGPQDHPSFDPILMSRPGGCSPERMSAEYEVPTEMRGKFLCESAFKNGEGTYCHIALEEFCEVVGATNDPVNLRTELIQLAAVCVAWVEAIDRKGIST